MAGTKAIRLSKAAREFNVGTGTIVEFLHKKGHDIDGNANTKLTEDMYELLTDEYKAEKSVKEEARKKGISVVKHESISIEDRKRDEIDIEDYEEEDDIIIRGMPVNVDDNFKKSVEPYSEMREEIAVAAPAEPVVIEEEKPQIVESEPDIPKEVIQQIEKEVVVEEVIEEKTAPHIEAKEIAEQTEPAEEIISEKETVKESTQETEKVVVEKAGKEITSPEPVTVSEEKKVEPVEEEKEKPVAKTVEEPTPEKATHLKVIGKIDLSTINERTKPPKKTAEEKRKEKEKRRQEEKTRTDKRKQVLVDEKKPVQEAKVPDPTPEKPVETPPVVEVPKEEVVEKNFLKTRFEKLQGPNIVGRIELPVTKRPEKKKPVASSSDDKVKPKKKKRKRIRKPEPPKAQERLKTDEKAKPRQFKGKKPRFATPKVEPTQEEIQKQIKETLARLSGAGKSKASKHRRQKRDMVHKQKEKDEQVKEQEKSIITVTEFVTANELASMMNIQVTEVISMCMQLGLVVSINQRLDAETISLLSEEFGYSVEFASAESTIDEDTTGEEEESNLVPRAPIVTVMGHVDHGKTKLLDYIRHANVVAGEAGGITQHIGAYEVNLESGKRITFLDTPGHEAFTAMRARGAKVTDVAIIVIAADDNVMPQTKEAINHALAANVPIVFAINKMDKPTANAEKIKDQLSQMNILVEDWGGKYQSQEISAKGGLNIDELLDKVLLEAELLDVKGNPERRAIGTIIESSLDKGRGYVAKLLVQNGTLKAGDIVLAGSHYGKVKAMYNERNQLVKDVGPSAPVLMLGLSGAPQAGDLFKVMADEREAKNIATKRMQLQREQGLRTQKHITLDEIGRRIAIGDFKELNIIVKGDVDGSVEALADSLLKLSTQEVQVNVIHKSVGQVTETDVMLASASNAIIVAFQVRPSVGARKLAEKEQIDIRLYSIIYAAIEEIKSAIEGMLSPDIEEKILCNIEVRDVFKITKVGTIAGCMVLDGIIQRKTNVRIIRDGIVIYTGKLGSLKRFKDDVKEVGTGYECGLNIENFNDIKVGDIVEGFEEVSVARKLD
nr:translation initiation factor IF-2 [Bacteroidota bacterium]